MKTKGKASTGPKWAVQFIFPGVLAFASLPAFATGAGDSSSTTFRSDVSHFAVTAMPAYTVEELQSAKTHTLFMGADIAINLDRDTYNVRDVLGSNWVIDINGRAKKISTKEAPLNLKITPRLKLTEDSVTIVGFRKLPAYSYENDPSVRLTKNLVKSASDSADLRAVAENAQYRVDTMSSLNMGGAAWFAGADDQFSDHAMKVEAEYAYSDTHGAGLGPGGLPLPSPTAPTATANTTGNNGINALNIGIASNEASIADHQTENGNEPAGRIATMGLDAMDVEFDVRSAKPLNNPYIVTMARFHGAAGKPGMVQNMVYAQSLHPIDEHLSHVHFIEPGFPFNYELLDFQLHIYDRGVEIATNISADRVELTRDEAFEYVKIEYIGAHRGETLPAVPAMAKFPNDLRSKLRNGEYGASLYVRVSKDGLAYKVYSDPACTHRINDAYLDSVVQRIRFKPALDVGKPAEGIAVLNLGQLAI